MTVALILESTLCTMRQHTHTLNMLAKHSQLLVLSLKNNLGISS